MRTFARLLSPRIGQAPLAHQLCCGGLQLTNTESAALLPCRDENPSYIFPMIDENLLRDRSVPRRGPGRMQPFRSMSCSDPCMYWCSKDPALSIIGSSNEARDLKEHGLSFIQGLVHWHAVRLACFDPG